MFDLISICANTSLYTYIYIPQFREMVNYTAIYGYNICIYVLTSKKQISPITQSEIYNGL
jgi:hypothetical protein